MTNWKKTLLLIIVVAFVGINCFIIFSKLFSTPKPLAKTPHVSQLVSWGDNDFGQLGVNNDAALTQENPLAAVQLSEPVKSVAAGINYSVVVTENGSVYSWGNNNSGQLGIGSSARQLAPKKVENLPSITQVAASQFHSLALDSSGAVWAWGLNGSGQLGDGSYVDRNTPVPVQNLTDVKAIGTGYRMSWALKNDGTVWVWGADCTNNGQTEYQKFLKSFANSEDLLGTYFDIGIASITEENEAANCIGEQWINIHSPIPIQVPNLSNVSQVSAGFGHFLILQTDGIVLSWGCNIYGQLGHGFSDNNESVKTPQVVIGLPHITAISAGFRHSLALDDAGTIWAWGSNHKGESGQDISDSVTSPKAMSGLPKITFITAGQEYSLAVDESGTVWGWGENGYTQLGVNGPLYTTTPNKLEEKWTFSQLDAGGGHVIGVATLRE